MHHPTDRITHTTAFVTPVVEHWLEREIAQRVHPMKDRSDDPLHHELHLALSQLNANSHDDNSSVWNSQHGIIFFTLQICFSRSITSTEAWLGTCPLPSQEVGSWQTPYQLARLQDRVPDKQNRLNSSSLPNTRALSQTLFTQMHYTSSLTMQSVPVYQS